MGEPEIRRSAHAKVNLFLRVLGPREDGYHDLDSIVLPLSLADRLSVRRAPALRLEVRGEEELTGGVPGGVSNLALVAALALAEACPKAGGAEIVVEKHIPVAAGLGGGSADAAAVLRALNELWACGLGPDGLASIGARVGSDVPALLAGGPVRVGGRGERVEPARAAATWWTLVRLGFGVRAPAAFRWWDEDGGATGPAPDALVAAAAAGDATAVGGLLFNDLEEPVARRHPEVAEAKRRLVEAGALGAIMSGSGPAVAALARDEDHARELAGGFPDAVVAASPP